MSIQSKLQLHWKNSSKYQCTFRQGLGVQYCLVFVTKKWQKPAGNSKALINLLNNLPKVLIVFCMASSLLNLMLTVLACHLLLHRCLTNRKQGSKINYAYCCWGEILLRISQSSILGPFLFRVLICDLFFMLSNKDLVHCISDTITLYHMLLENGWNEAIDFLKKAQMSSFSSLSVMK